MAALCEIKSAMKLLRCFHHTSPFSTSGIKFYATAGGSGSSKKPSSKSSASSDVPNVSGLSKKVLDMPNTEVGPGASKTAQYKNPEYFCYNAASYFEAEVEMLKYRCPQPSSKAPPSK